VLELRVSAGILGTSWEVLLARSVETSLTLELTHWGGGGERQEKEGRPKR